MNIVLGNIHLLFLIVTIKIRIKPFSLLEGYKTSLNSSINGKHANIYECDVTYMSLKVLNFLI